MKVLIPTALRQYAGGQSAIVLDAASVDDMLGQLGTLYPDLRRHLFDPQGRLRKFVNIYVNDEDIRYLAAERTPVQPDDTISIIPSVAGGSPYSPESGTAHGNPH